MNDSPAWPALHEQLARWTAAGLIGPEQATRIESAEAARTEAAEIVMTQAPPEAKVGVGVRAVGPVTDAADQASAVAGAGPDGAGPDGAGPDGAGPDGAGPDGAGPDGAGPAEGSSTANRGVVTARRLFPTRWGNASAGQSAGGARGSAAHPHRRLPLVVEALGYAGAVIAIAAGYVAVDMHWPNLPPRAELTFAGVVGVVLLITGSLLRTGSEPALGRLRSVLWLISTISVAAFVAVLASEFWHLSGVSSALLAETVASLYAIALWWRSRAALQQLATFGAIAALAGTGVGKLAPGSHLWGAGLGIWILAVLWAFAEYRGYLVPRTVGYVAAGVGLLLGAQLTMGTAAGQLLAMGTVAGLLAVGVVLRRALLVGFGAAGAIVLIPQTASRYLPGSAGALAVAAVGLILLGTALWLAKSRRTT